MDIEAICNRFGITGEVVACDVIKSGNINDTFRVTFRQAEGDLCYIIQHIKTHVFKEPVRTRAQITLAKDIIERYDELDDVVKTLL